MHSSFFSVRSIIGLGAGALLATGMAFGSCDKNDDSAPSNTGSAATTMKATDAPIDNDSIQGAYITIADIRLDGQSIQGFQRTTINLMDYTNGNTTTIGNFNLRGASYSNITFVLDYNTDQNGNIPGTYLLTKDNVKHKLQAAVNTITVDKSYTLYDTAANSFVADFDLRRMVVYKPGDSSTYTLAGGAALQHSVRFTEENKSSSISGSIINNITDTDAVVAYAYKKGSYNASTETNGSAQFSNAVASSLVDHNGQYSFHFMDSGLYEIHFASYRRNPQFSGRLSLRGMLNTTASGLDILSLNLGLNASLTVNATATGINDD